MELNRFSKLVGSPAYGLDGFSGLISDIQIDRKWNIKNIIVQHGYWLPRETPIPVSILAPIKKHTARFPMTRGEMSHAPALRRALPTHGPRPEQLNSPTKLLGTDFVSVSDEQTQIGASPYMSELIFRDVSDGLTKIGSIIDATIEPVEFRVVDLTVRTRANTEHLIPLREIHWESDSLVCEQPYSTVLQFPRIPESANPVLVHKWTEAYLQQLTG